MEIEKTPIFRIRDLKHIGIPYSRFLSLLREGSFERISRGLYRLAEYEPTENYTLAIVGKASPKAIFCLLTALRYHGIGTQDPGEAWIAIDRKARKPLLNGLPVRIVRFAGASLTHGIQMLTLDGVKVRITGPARTVVDCFRYRNKIGLDVALEALREALRSRKATREDIRRAAAAVGGTNVIRPYMESLSL